MKRVLLFWGIMAVVMTARAYDMAYTYEGKTLYYDLVADGAYVTFESMDETNYSKLHGVVNIPSKVPTNVGDYPVVGIGYSAFASCNGMSALTVPQSVKYLGSNFVANCTALRVIIMKSTIPPTIEGNTFEKMVSSVLIRVPSNALEVYQASGRWPNLVAVSTAGGLDLKQLGLTNERLKQMGIDSRSRSVVKTSFQAKKSPSSVNKPESADACFAKGEESYGRGDFENAANWYRKAAEKGHAQAQYYLGDAYFHGDGVAVDYQQAVYWLEKAGYQGVLNAQFNVALCYLHGKGVDQSNSKAAYWFEKAAEQGDAIAQVNIGVCYENGMGVEQNYEEAVEWFRKSAEQGNAKAQCGLGRYYSMRRDHEQAVYWYRKAAAQGQFEAQKYLEDNGYTLNVQY